METSRDTQLKEFDVSRFHMDDESGSYDMLKVVCPRKGCGLEHWVPPVWGVIRLVVGRTEDVPARVSGRVCPHCSKTSLVPPKYRIEPEQKPRRTKLKIKRRPK